MGNKGISIMLKNCLQHIKKQTLYVCTWFCLQKVSRGHMLFPSPSACLFPGPPRSGVRNTTASGLPAPATLGLSSRSPDWCLHLSPTSGQPHRPPAPGTPGSCRRAGLGEGRSE